MRRGLLRILHAIPYTEIENMADPDDVNSWTCSACRLPIFSTPFVVDKSRGSNLLLHNKCSDESLPPKLTAGHTMHPRGALGSRRGGTSLPKMFVDLWEQILRVPDRSHKHRLTAVKRPTMSMSSHSFVCGACGKKHAPPVKDAVKAYTCTSCDFWIHPDCTLLPNTIVDTACHEHPLLLGFSVTRFNQSCKICTLEITTFGFYACVVCRYYVHIDCGVNSRHHRFKPVFQKFDDYCSFRPKVATKPFNIFECAVCKCKCNGSAYFIEGGEQKYIDVVCALMPHLITHRAHGKAHILQGKLEIDRGGEEEETGLCEICKKGIDWIKWHYGCEECGQYFHANCIPCLNRLSKIKFGFEVSVRCHGCPVACVRAVSVDGYLCGHCGKNIRESDDIAFECSKCYFRMDKGCVQELMKGT
ncbi:cysteine/Histidine-rich C1 domain family protein [Striga asiatica]|uniref:Cysteine/Histidine-rich C1 domain family protein n=1 Tax=Striga asiatica TaxID=4170 RepID=A0A5A7QY13_STRAF|nr:cysteine/Histidine-rich C1 domain family protein [Striga asiatica]